MRNPRGQDLHVFGEPPLKSCTQDIREFIVDLPVGKRYVFVDTPGFDNTCRSDRDILRTIADWLGDKRPFMPMWRLNLSEPENISSPHARCSRTDTTRYAQPQRSWLYQIY
ncbi:hypothetical protein EDC04DRAFT_2757081 [Pisolithus marmoratus]|nr:hypothetical protein EDC04DRAFT_2757081 [Pisolithus marmoratus]